MLCEICGQNEATFHYSEVINGSKTEHHLCSECAAKTDIGYYSELFDSDGKIGQFLSGLLGYTPVHQQDSRGSITCPSCGMTYGDFVNKSVFGCNECYSVFGPLLSDSIKKIHGSVGHQGKKPFRFGAPVEQTGEHEDELKNDHEVSIRNKIEALQNRLNDALGREDFEEAARLRDTIRELRQQEV